MDKVVRFDDVCINADISNHIEITNIFKQEGFRVIWAVSPLVHEIKTDDTTEMQRVYPRILNAYSDVRHFYQVDRCGIPTNLDPYVELASHGLIHADHRLLTKEVQEMSILISCSLLKANKFVPPFNKYTKQMDEVCREHGIELIKFEHGWKSMEFNSYIPTHGKWYLHAREWNKEKVIDWLK